MKTFIKHTLLSLFLSAFCLALNAQEQQGDFLQMITEGKMNSRDYPNMSRADQKFMAYEKGMLPTYENDIRNQALSRAIPSNDDCGNAIEVWCGSTVSGSTLMATSDNFVYDYILGYAPGVWYKFAGNGKRVTFSSCNNTFYDARLTIFEGGCGDPNFLGTNDDHCPGALPEATINTEWGKDYYIYVSGYFSSRGNFEMSVTCDNFCDITNVSNPNTECSIGGNYSVGAAVYGAFFPLNGTYKIVIGGQTFHIDRTNYNESDSDMDNVFNLEYTSGNYSSLYLPKVDKYGTNMDFFIQVDNGCTWTIQNDFNSPDCQLPTCPEGDVRLNTQQDVDNFRRDYPNCEKISGYLWIYGENNGGDIRDLTPLSNLEEVEGGLIVYRNNQLRSLNGLSNIDEIGTILAVDTNPLLENLYGLGSFRRLEGIFIWRNPLLQDLRGLDNLEYIEERLEVAQNERLISLAGLNRVRRAGGNDEYVLILRNNSLMNLNGLSGLKVVEGDLVIQGNPLLRSLDGLENLERVEDVISLYDHQSLENLNSFRNLRYVGSTISVEKSPQLTDFTGLCPLFNNGFSGDFIQNENGAIFNPETECLTSENCDITGILGHGVNCTGGATYDLWIDFLGYGMPTNGGTLEKVVMAGNTYRDIPYWYVGGGTYRFYLYGLTSYNRNNLDVFIAAVDGQCTWTARDLVDEPNCSAARMGYVFETGLKVYPNPNAGKFTVIATGVDQPEVSVFNQLGQVVYKSKVESGSEHHIQLNDVERGVYFVRLVGENYIETQKLILAN